MTKIYPNKIDVDVAAEVAAIDSTSTIEDSSSSSSKKNIDEMVVALTVWKKSLVLNWSGFTVFDSEGKVVYRVDNDDDMQSGRIFLMDASGATLLTIRRKRRLALGAETWLIFRGEEDDRRPPIFSVRKNLLNRGLHLQAHNKSKYQIEGSYGLRCCAVYDVDRRRRVAEIRQKEASVKGGLNVDFGKDVFRLLVHPGPGFDAAVAMAIVILLDQM